MSGWGHVYLDAVGAGSRGYLAKGGKMGGAKYKDGAGPTILRFALMGLYS